MDSRSIEARVLLVIVEERIATLWRHRQWFRDHVGWIVQEQVDEREELRYLVALLRKARAIAGPEVEASDVFTTWKRARDIADLADGDHFVGLDHLPSSRVHVDNVEGDPAFNGSFR